MLKISRIRACFLLTSIFLPVLTFSQSLSVFDVDVSYFPTLKAKFYAFDIAGNPVSGISTGEVIVWEDETPRTVTRVLCPPVALPEAISSILTIDVSGSMSGGGIQYAKAAARAWVAAMTLGRSECAITSFNSRSYLNQDFTTDRTALLDAIDALRSGGMTDYDAALLRPPAGSLEVSKRGRNKKVVVFLSDGMPNHSPNQGAIIAEARRQNVTIYAVILGMSAQQVVKDICSQTGGLWFENIATEQEAKEAYRQILQTARGGTPCELEWISEGCSAYRSLEIAIPALGVSVRTRYQIPLGRQSQLAYTPSRSVHFGYVTPGTQQHRQVILTAQDRQVHIDRITTSHPWFRVVDYGGIAPPFTLNVGQSRTLTMEYAPADSSYSFCRFGVEGDACRGASFYADGGWSTKWSSQVTIKVLRPNGSEQFVAGSNEELSWEGVMPEDKVRLEYSTDGGTNWMLITEKATGLRYMWRVPETPSNECLLRVTAKARQIIIDDMVLIPAGKFRMGNITDNPDGQFDEKPVHEVHITRPFLMSRTEVTQAQYEAVMGNNPSYFVGDDHPVDMVRWYDAIEFCNRLSKLEGLDTCYSGSGTSIVCDFTANGYRLPTEAEWEYACRGGTETDFYTGNMTNSECIPLDSAMDRAGWYCGNSENIPRAVGLREPNNFGLYDMHGNVWEWCWDRYGVFYYESKPAVYPRGPSSGSARVIRSGDWNTEAKFCRSANRFNLGPTYRDLEVGFRVVRTY